MCYGTLFIDSILIILLSLYYEKYLKHHFPNKQILDPIENKSKKKNFPSTCLLMLIHHFQAFATCKKLSVVLLLIIIPIVGTFNTNSRFMSGKFINKMKKTF